MRVRARVRVCVHACAYVRICAQNLTCSLRLISKIYFLDFLLICNPPCLQIPRTSIFGAKFYWGVAWGLTVTWVCRRARSTTKEGPNGSGCCCTTQENFDVSAWRANQFVQKIGSLCFLLSLNEKRRLLHGDLQTESKVLFLCEMMPISCLCKHIEI